MTDMKSSPRNFQETASAMLRNMTPLLAKARSLSFKKMLLPSPETDRSSQQTDLIKWQQEMFHRVLNTMCLAQEGLVDPAELEDLRKKIIRTLVAYHPNGEWADFTRDKLLFLQDLFQARCISEEDYHTAKQPLLSRLAAQGAELDLQDFKFNATDLKAGTESRIPSVSTPTSRQQVFAETELPADAGSVTGAAKKKTPIKHVMDAVARLKSSSAAKKLDLSYFDDKHSKEEGKPHRVPHALDFLRPPDCPTREPPVTPVKQKHNSEDCFDSPLFKTGSTGSTTDLLRGFSSDTTDLLPHLSNMSLDETDSPPSVPSSPAPVTQPKSLCHSKSLTPSKLSFTPKSALGFSRSESRRLPLSASPKGKLEYSLSRKFSGLLRGWQKAEPDKICDEDDAKSDDEGHERMTPNKKSLWQKLDLLGGPKKRLDVDDDDDFGKEISDKDPLLAAIDEYPAEKVRSAFIHGQGPNVKKLKKKVSIRPAPTNFFIDQVVGDNIKNELDRIREEMSRRNPSNQAFTDDQIDAIATRLPVDKNELMRFFPKSWCERYGDIVLEVVHKEFKCHVTEMDGLRKATHEKRKSRLKDPENDENRRSSDSFHTAEMPSPKSSHSRNSPKPSFQSSSEVQSNPKPSPHVRRSPKPLERKVYTTEGSDLKGASVHENKDSLPIHVPPAAAAARVRRGLGYEEMDVKLGAEILRMPFRNFNESSRF